jgi:predicted acylesterase/phospholipase RssA
MTVTARSAWETEVDQASKFPENTEVWKSRSPRQINALRKSFEESYNSLLDTFPEDVVPKESQESFRADAAKLFDDIVRHSFDAAPKKSGRIPELMARQAILKANLGAQDALNKLRAKYAQPDMRPQVVPFRDTTQVALIKKAPQLETLVLSGGGAKGVGNAPALVALENARMLDGVKHIVGTSAGALTAVCLACNFNASSFKELSDRINPNDLKKEIKDYDIKYPDLPILPRTGIHNAGNPVEIMDKETSKSVGEYLRDNWGKPEFQQKYEALSQPDRDRLTALSFQDYSGDHKEDYFQNYARDRTKQMVTFKDLQILHKFAPSKFKELTLTGFDEGNKRTEYFDAAHTPNMPLAYAGRISMSIPKYFSKVKYDIGKGPTNWVDGGVGSNMPSEVVFGQMDENSREYGEARARTMLMPFDNAGGTNKKLHGDWAARTAVDPDEYLLAAGSGNSNYLADTVRDAQKTFKGGPNSFVVFHGDIKTTHLDASEKRKDFATLLSQMKSLEQINARQNQAYHEVFPSVLDAFMTLSDADIDLIRKGGEPHYDPFKMDGRQDSVAKELYGLAADFSDAKAKAGETFETLRDDEKVDIRQRGRPTRTQFPDPARLLSEKALYDLTVGTPLSPPEINSILSAGEPTPDRYTHDREQFRVHKDLYDLAVGDAFKIPDPRDRFVALVKLVPRLDGADREAALNAALGAAHKIPDHGARASAFLDLRTHLDGDLRQVAEDAVTEAFGLAKAQGPSIEE